MSDQLREAISTALRLRGYHEVRTSAGITTFYIHPDSPRRLGDGLIHLGATGTTRVGVCWTDGVALRPRLREVLLREAQAILATQSAAPAPIDEVES